MVVDGIVFDSRKEGRRYLELSNLQKAGMITDLQRQVVFELIPTQYEWVESGSFYRRGDKKGQPKMERRVVEKGVKYIADFVYTDWNGNIVVEDIKSAATKTKEYTIKRKLMLHIHGIRVKEV
jgi:hypothetical protein